MGIHVALLEAKGWIECQGDIKATVKVKLKRVVEAKGWIECQGHIKATV